MRDAISNIFLNPLVWVYTVYKVQRELYMFLIQQFDNDPRLLKSLCRLPRVLDIISQFYWGSAKCQYAMGGKPLLHPITKEVLGERPSQDEIHKIRLLLLSLGEMSLRYSFFTGMPCIFASSMYSVFPVYFFNEVYADAVDLTHASLLTNLYSNMGKSRQNIAASDIKALIAFFETSQDMACIEDVLHMVIRAVSQKPLLASFLEQVDSLGGCQIFVNLLQRYVLYTKLKNDEF